MTIQLDRPFYLLKIPGSRSQREQVWDDIQTLPNLTNSIIR